MGEPKQILVIDDEEVIHSSLERILTRQGFVVDSSLTVKDAFARLEQKKYDLIITDLMMPEMNGIELLEELKRRKCRVPSIMITGYPTIKTAVQSMRLGAVDYVSKPFTRKEILSPVNRALRRCEAEGTTGGEEQSNNGAEETETDFAELTVAPGDKYYLPGHSWAHYQLDGTVLIGLEPPFLSSVGEIVEIDTPEQGDLLEQGYKSLTFKTAAGEVHYMFAPVGGRVIECNDEALANPATLRSENWLIRIIPSQLTEDLALLKKKG